MRRKNKDVQEVRNCVMPTYTYIENTHTHFICVHYI